MLAKFFYPDELTVVIVHLKEEGDLNKDALKPLNRPINYYYLPLASTIILYMLNGMMIQSVDWEVAWGFICIALLLLVYIPFNIQGFWKSFMAAYVLGELETGVVLSSRVTVFWYVIIEVKLYRSGEIINVYTNNPITLLHPFSNPSYMPVAGDQISVFVSKNKTHCAVPAIEGYMQKACLKKSLIKQYAINPETTVSGQ